MVAMRKVRVAVVGAGLISHNHIRAYETMGRSAEVVAIVETDPARREAASRRYPSLRVLADHRMILDAPTVDLVDICTPPASHSDLVVAALEAGKLVVCEKPLAPTLDDVDRILAVARTRPGRLSTVHQFRTLPEIRAILSLRDRGDLGELLFGLFADYDRTQGPPIGAKNWWGEWRTAGGGVGMTRFIHHLDLMCLIFGRAVEATALIGTLAAAIESEDTLSTTIRFAGGAIVGGSATIAAHTTAFRFDVIGTRGSAHYPWALHLEGRDAVVRAIDRSTSREIQARTGTGLGRRGLRRARLIVRPGSGRSTNHAEFLKSIVEAAIDDRPFPMSPEEARRPVELCIAVYASALLGTPIRLPLSPDMRFYGGVSASDYRNAMEERRAQGNTEQARLP